MFICSVLPRNCPKPVQTRLNECGLLIRRFRMEAKWSQEMFTAKLQLAGWDIDQSGVARIESGGRTLLDYELKFILNVLGKDWKDIVSDTEPRNCPEPHGEKQNQSGTLIRRFRNELGWTQEMLVEKLQLAGWKIDRSLLVLIEQNQRLLLDYELKFFLDALEKNWNCIFRK